MGIFIWLIQIVVFFSVVSSIMNALSKNTKKNQSSNKRNVFNEPTQTYSGSANVETAPKPKVNASSSKNSTQHQTVEQRRSARNRTVRDATNARGAARDITTERDRRRLEREKLDQARNERTNKLRRQANNSLTEVTSLKSKSKSKKSDTAIYEFTEDNIVRAFTYKEILDKPLALRED
ncbi:hypothetical protein [Marinilactibacillus kalidii]|uniref:hypothetical protein n=1 Tax=Marinilactibacillus kalidii TaxID=2820274 RepID=UPI001ABE932C|nr:hypothetical protein [Marinilactibacillus kalidii]